VQQEVQAAVIAVCMGGATYFRTATSTPSSARPAPTRVVGALLRHGTRLYSPARPTCLLLRANLRQPAKGLSSSGRGRIRGFATVSQVTTQAGHLPSCSTDKARGGLYITQPRVCAMESRMLDAIVS
jgi:hypothetical protein